MNIKPSTESMEEYLKSDDVIDYNNAEIAVLAGSIYKRAGSKTEFIKAAYEFVRDKIFHSADIKEDIITCSASEVLKAGHGICFAKSH